MTRPLSLLAFVVAVAWAVPLAGCADAVDPTVGTAQAFSVYGYLDPTADRQALRVVPIEATLGADTTAAVDATVTSVEPATGRTAAWRDSAVTFRDGSVGHVFVADYTPTPGAAIEVTVRASDGRQAAVSVETPPLARPTVGAPLPGLGLATYPVTVAGVPRVIAGTLRLFVTGRPGTTGTTAIEVPVRPLRIRDEGGGTWTVDVPFLEATRDRLQELGLSGGALTLVEAEFAPFVANAAWAVPPGGFDEDAVVEPGTFSNVAGGFGFVGAGYRAPVRWVPSTSVQARAGFAVTNDPAAQVAINEVGDGYVELFNPTAEPIDVSGYRLSSDKTGEEATVPNGSVMSPGAFLVVDGPFDATSDDLIQYLTASGRLLKSTPVGGGTTAWGAYPDGFSYRLPRAGPDLFYGPVTRTPGGPNRPTEVPFVINEVSTSGDGYVEVVARDRFAEGIPVLASSGEALVRATEAVGTYPFLVADEDAEVLVLDQLGGAVFVLIDLQVRDARFYGPQSPGRSTGYLPDGPDGAWSEGLRPTRGAPNALARFGL